VADGNGDGKIDIMLNSTFETNLYLNNGNKTFSQDPGSTFRQLSVGGAKWGDFDKDGDLDIAVTGLDSQNNYHSLIYENMNGNTKGSFIERTDIALKGLGVNGHNGTLWYDYNNDGRLDLLLTGRSIGSGGWTNRQYRNEGGDSFAEIIEPAFDPLDNMSLDAGDFDNDGDLDLSFLGFMFSSQEAFAGYFKNTVQSGPTVSNTLPAPPSSSTFSETFYRKEIRFSWGVGSDEQTPVNGLTYNFYLRDATKKVIVPNVDFSNGFICSTNPANGFGRHGFANNVPEGDLYYAVQSIDGSKAGSLFSSEKTFYHFNGPESVKAEIVDDDDVTLTWIDHSILETNFNIDRSTSPTTGFISVATLPANTITHTDHFTFLTETYYYFRINGYNATQTSPYDSLILIIPERPTNLQVQSINASKIHLTWNDESQHETGFLLERKTSAQSIYATIATLPPDTESYDDTGLTQCVVYDYRVRAIGANGSLPPIAIASARTNCLPIVTNFQKECLEDSQLTFTSADFDDNVSDADPSDQLVYIKISALPANGSFKLSDTQVTINQLILFDQLDQLTFTPNENFNGTALLSAYAYDGKDYSSDAWMITLNILSVNDPPSFEIASTLTVNEDFAGESLVTPTATIIPYEIGDNIMYSVSPETSEIVNVAINPATGQLTFTSIQDQFGEIEITITANDGHAENNTLSKSFTLTVNTVNDPPVLGVFADMEAEVSEDIPPILITITDVDSEITTSMFTATSSNQDILKNQDIAFNVNEVGEAYMTLDARVAIGETTITVTANDGSATDSESFILTMYSVTGIGNPIPEGKIIVFPNPVEQELTIFLEAASTGQNTLLMQDILGREQVSVKFMSPEIKVSTEGMTKGVYLIKITLENGTLITRKILKK